MVDAYHYFANDTAVTNNVSITQMRDWGHEWMECVDAFVEFQQRSGFLDTGPSFPPAAAGVWPTEIGVWMKNRRPWKDVGIANTAGFVQKWWGWWSSLQPDSRTANDMLIINMNWEKLKKPGRNGFLLIILSLVWWGKASSRDEEWQMAVAEVSKVLCCMLGGFTSVPDPPEHGSLNSSSAANAVATASSKRRQEGGVTGGTSTKKRRVVD
jgi:hypothetical protein